jgi:plasmid stabilization system protein ParE
MSLPVTFRHEAELDLSQTAVWYEERRSGLGRDFLDAVQRVVDRISTHPEAHGRVYRDVREARVPRFPYNVMYTLTPNRIKVIAVVHGHRDDRHWKSRTTD